jgi:hypothetical protein
MNKNVVYSIKLLASPGDPGVGDEPNMVDIASIITFVNGAVF